MWDLSPWFAAIVGIASGIVIGIIAEYYTSYDYKPTKSCKGIYRRNGSTITNNMAVVSQYLLLWQYLGLPLSLQIILPVFMV